MAVRYLKQNEKMNAAQPKKIQQMCFHQLCNLLEVNYQRREFSMLL